MEILNMPAVRHTKPLMIYDGDCSFCRIWIDYWRQLTGDAVEYKPYQEVADQYQQIPREQFQKSVQLIMENGAVLDGAHAVFQSLAYNSNKRWMLWMYKQIPGVGFFTEFCYRFITRNRDAAYKVTRLLWGRQIDVSSKNSSRA